MALPCHAEPIGRLNPDFGLLRWWWHGRSVEVANEGEAHLLAKVAAQIARADGVLRIEDDYGVSFIALFEGTPAPRTLRKPAPKQALAPQSVGGEVSLDDADVEPLSIEPEPASSERGPSILVQEALAVTTRATNGEFAQALLSVVVEVDEGAAVQGRFFVDVVALDPKGELVSVDATRALIDAAAHTIAADAQSGNGRWRKLLVRLRRTVRGASVEVDVRP